MTNAHDASWLTHVRVERLLPTLHSVSKYPPPGPPVRRAARIVWEACGGPLEEVEALLQILRDLAMVRDDRGYLRATKKGRQLVSQNHQTGGRGLAHALIHAGKFAQQARRLLEVSDHQADGSITCRRDVARRQAPQLVGLLQRWPNVQMAPLVRVPANIVVELAGPWALLQRPEPTTDTKREVGERAELYSYLLERIKADDVTSIHWVSRDDDSLGYDIEDTGSANSRRIEVKGSRGVRPRFYLSGNEWNVAHEHADSYEIHFWGRIDLSRDHQAEFDALRGQGYPVVFKDLRTTLGRRRLSVTVDTYLLTEDEERALDDR